MLPIENIFPENNGNDCYSIIIVGGGAAGAAPAQQAVKAASCSWNQKAFWHVTLLTRVSFHVVASIPAQRAQQIDDCIGLGA